MVFGSVKKRNHKHHFSRSRPQKLKNCTTLAQSLLIISPPHTHPIIMHHFAFAMDNSHLLQFLPNTTTSTNNTPFFHHAQPQTHTTFSTNSSNNTSYYPFHLSQITETPSHHDRALAAMKNHKEAEKRRRERINSHLDKLRTLLPCNSKTDKASLLAKVVQRVKELKQQTSEITELETVPSETDEITVFTTTGGDYASGGGDGRLIFKASLCCEDRSDLIPDLIEILNSLHLKTLKAEMATLGGRTRNVLVVAADKEHSIESIHFLQNSLKSILERSRSGDRSKRRRGLDRRLMS